MVVRRFMGALVSLELIVVALIVVLVGGRNGPDWNEHHRRRRP